MTTLADMTPAQRAECVGMWCESPHGLTIIADFCTPEEDHGYGAAKLLAPSFPSKLTRCCNHSDITPRRDLPRAWNPDGTPPTK